MAYELLEVEKELLASNISTQQLNILQRNSVTRLKEKLQHKTLYFHSSNEEHQHLRILIFTLLTHIYCRHSQHSQHILNTFKQLVYGAELSAAITTSQGIEARQLFKFVAEKLQGLEIEDRIQQTVCNLINSSTFFEEVVFNAILNKVTWPPGADSGTQISILKQFFQTEFDISVLILEEKTKRLSQISDQLVLFRFGPHLFKKAFFSEQELSLSSIQRIARTFDKDTPISPSKLQESINMETSQVQEITPILGSKNSTGQKGSGCKITPFNYNDGSDKKRRDSRKKKTGGVFGMFCCCDD